MTEKSATSKSTERIHVISRKDGWAIKKEGNPKASEIYSTKDAAVKDAKKFASKGHDVVVHRRDGTIQEWVKPK
jgi:uncharacterized protein YdaT